MSNVTSPKPAITFAGTSIDLADEPRGPIITFEFAPAFGHVVGLIDICLVTTRSVPGAEGKIVREACVVANLRCTQAGATDLKNAIDGALLMLQPVENPDGPKN